MPKDKGTVKVKPIPGESFSFYIESWGSRQEPHKVDLMAFNWNGECSCQDFSGTCWRNMKAQLGYGPETRVTHEMMEEMATRLKKAWYGTIKDKNPFRTRCRHITVGFHYVDDNMLPILFKQ